MRLIDADKLKLEADTCRETTDAFIAMIDKQPTAVTCCKDCHYAIPSSNGVYLCSAPFSTSYPPTYRKADWFCAGGKPRTETIDFSSLKCALDKFVNALKNAKEVIVSAGSGMADTREAIRRIVDNDSNRLDKGDCRAGTQGCQTPQKPEKLSDKGGQ